MVHLVVFGGGLVLAGRVARVVVRSGVVHRVGFTCRIWGRIRVIEQKEEVRVVG